MANLIPNEFSSYELSPNELAQGSVLSFLQQCCIQNQISELAHRKLALPRTPDNVQEEAELQGSIRSLQYLLTLSKSYEAQLVSPENVQLNTDSPI